MNKIETHEHVIPLPQVSFNCTPSPLPWVTGWPVNSPPKDKQAHSISNHQTTWLIFTPWLNIIKEHILIHKELLTRCCEGIFINIWTTEETKSQILGGKSRPENLTKKVTNPIYARKIPGRYRKCGGKRWIIPKILQNTGVCLRASSNVARTRLGILFKPV